MKTNAPLFKPMSPCLRLFIQSLLADGAENIFEEYPLADDPIAGNAAFVFSVPRAVKKNYNSRRFQCPFVRT
jgi:hypothetical protein